MNADSSERLGNRAESQTEHKQHGVLPVSTFRFFAILLLGPRGAVYALVVTDSLKTVAGRLVSLFVRRSKA